MEHWCNGGGGGETFMGHSLSSTYPTGLAWDSATNRQSHVTDRLLEMSGTSVIKKRCVFSQARTHC